MRVSEIFTMSGDWGHGDNFERYLSYGGVDKPGGFYPDTGRWAYVAPNSYRFAGDGSGYGFSRSRGLDGLVG